ncbi:MAG: pyridoxal phosphate-dependent aminotransferase [Bacteroidaceae bacterium]|nr:pyridoxal phosphate-dependent aminotransferase [Bacteroidaceae bacterium]
MNTTYNFDEVIERRGTNCVKWDDSKDEVLPMWVADMDFRAATPITEALQRRMAHGVFGYAQVPDAYYDAIINWFGRRYNWSIQREEIIYTSGVIPALAAVLKAVTLPGEKVLVQTPVYNCFFSSITNSGTQVVESPLVEEGDSYVIDFDDFEQKASDPKVTAFLLCNPHNPAGRVWTEAELLRMGEICMKHHVTVISDEIHCELIMHGHRFTPYATLSPQLRSKAVICNSPTKNFNVAGLHIANIIVSDPELRRRIDRVININEVCEVNIFGIEALIAAYNECEDWITQLNAYLYENYRALRAAFEAELPQMRIKKLEGTYLVWLDVRSIHRSSEEIAQYLEREKKVRVNSSQMYGAEGFLRINIACPRALLMQGVGLIIEGLRELGALRG